MKHKLTNTELLNQLNKMTKKQLTSLGWDVSKGGDISRLRKNEMVKYIYKNLILILRDNKIDEILKK